MSDRSHNIDIAPDAARCQPSVAGKAANICARRRAEIGKAPLADFSIDHLAYQSRGCSPLCEMFLMSRIAVRQPAERTVKPWPTE